MMSFQQRWSSAAEASCEAVKQLHGWGLAEEPFAWLLAGTTLWLSARGVVRTHYAA